MEDFLKHIVCSLVNHPEHVSVASESVESGVRLSVSVLPEDAGLVIGKRGYVIRAIRQLVNVIANQNKSKAFVEVVPLED